MTVKTNMVTTLDLSQVARKISRSQRKSPDAAFISAFEALLLVVAMGLIEGNAGGTKTVGAYAFAMLVMGVALHAISVIKGSKERKASL
jgi:hypothetical protein